MPDLFFPIAQENRVVAFSPVVIASGLASIGEFIFRASPSADVSIPEGVRITQEKLGYQRVAMIADTVDFASRSSNEAYRKAFADNGIEVLTMETFATGDTDFSSQLTRIKALKPGRDFHLGTTNRGYQNP